MVTGPLNLRLNSTEIDLEPVRSFVRDFVLPYEAAHIDGEDFPHQLVGEMARLGLFKLITPKELGGVGASVVDLAWVIRELAYGSASFGATMIGSLLGYSTLILYARPELREQVVRQFMNETSLWSFGMTEAGAGSDLLNITTEARKIRGGYVLTGEKNFITNASFSSHLGVFAQLRDEDGKNLGVSCFYVPGDTAGLKRGPAYKKLGWKKSNTGVLYLNSVYLPESHLLGEPGQGLRILTHCLNRSKTLLAAMGVGISHRALDLAKERLLQTRRFGKPLLDQGVIRHSLARLYTRVEAAWLLTMQASATWDAKLPAVREASMAKLFSGATAMETTSQVMELFGARGLLREFEVSRLCADAKAIEIVEGPSLVQELLIAKEVLQKREEKKDEKKALDPFSISQRELESPATSVNKRASA